MGKYVSFPGLGIDPFHMEREFEVFGRPIAWYGVIICIGIILAVSYALFRAKHTEKISVDTMTDLALFLIPFGILGARLYYVLFYDLSQYIVTGKGFLGNLWGTFRNCIAVWEGGLAIYGAIIAGFMVIVVFCRVKKLKLMKVLDLAAPAVMIGQLIGRWGNFVNVEAYGSATTLPWRMGIHVADPLFENAAEMGMWVKESFVHPTFLYESLWNLLGFALVNLVYRKKKFDGQIFYFYIGWYGFGRMLIEGLRTDSLYIGAFRVSQLIGFATFAVGAFMSVFLYIRARRNFANALDSAVPAVEDAEGTVEIGDNTEVLLAREEVTENTSENTGEENGEDY